MRLYGADYRLHKEVIERHIVKKTAESPLRKEIRENQSAVQAHGNPNINLVLFKKEST